MPRPSAPSKENPVGIDPSSETILKTCVSPSDTEILSLFSGNTKCWLTPRFITKRKKGSEKKNFIEED
jgi:hypothetical protein